MERGGAFEIIDVSRGTTILDAQTYNVSDDDKKLKQTNGIKEFNIVSLHYNDTEESGSSWVNVDKEMRFAIDIGEMISYSSMTNDFALTLKENHCMFAGEQTTTPLKFSNSVFFQYKAGRFPFDLQRSDYDITSGTDSEWRGLGVYED